MKLKLDFLFHLPDDLKITHHSSLILLGSCFSDDIGAKFLRAGFDSVSNPFGTLFHPSAIANNLLNSLEVDPDLKIRDFGGYTSSWNTSTLVRARSVHEMQEIYFELLRSFKENLQRVDVIFITFGTAWGYELTEDGSIVANCHKQASNLFDKKLMGIDDIVSIWKKAIEKIEEINPGVQWVFTVSPVRHSKDGLIENNRSKARLIEACHELCELSSVNYFPSYEIVMDELRDHRFFKEDLVHPNKQAIDYVWERLVYTMMDDKTISLITDVQRLKTELDHRSINPESQEEKERIMRLNEKIGQFRAIHPEIRW